MISMMMSAGAQWVVATPAAADPPGASFYAASTPHVQPAQAGRGVKQQAAAAGSLLAAGALLQQAGPSKQTRVCCYSYSEIDAQICSCRMNSINIVQSRSPAGRTSNCSSYILEQ